VNKAADAFGVWLKALVLCVQATQFRHMLFSLALDHLVIAARSLEEGASYVESVLGLRLSPGGKHPNMGTHNLLMSLGPKEYLEVISIDPGAAGPAGRRWFGLDDFSDAPRMTNWVCRTDNLDDALDAAPRGTGVAYELARGDFHWSMGVPDSGRLPFEDAMPALIEWGAGSPHPSEKLPDLGARLTKLDVFHPEADRLKAAFAAFNGLGHVALRPGPMMRLMATIQTPEGVRVLA
jgi:catechol 2,3-dioxygenase-like lactoylglutathione lyase family enzyme